MSFVFTFAVLFGLVVLLSREGGVEGIGFALYYLFFAAFGLVMAFNDRKRGPGKTAHEKTKAWMETFQGRLARGELTFEEAEEEVRQLDQQEQAELDAWPKLQSWLAYATVGVLVALTLIGVNTGTSRGDFLAWVALWAAVILFLKWRQRRGQTTSSAKAPDTPSS